MEAQGSWGQDLSLELAPVSCVTAHLRVSVFICKMQMNILPDGAED